jgi:hypothetical protein
MKYKINHPCIRVFPYRLRRRLGSQMYEHDDGLTWGHSDADIFEVLQQQMGILEMAINEV